MAFYTTVRAPSAIAAGVFFTAVTGYVLLEDVWHGAPFTTKHLMTMAVLAGTVYFGHRFQIQLRAWKLGTAFGCAALFLAGTLACVIMSAGRNAEVVVTKALTVNAANSGRAAAQKDRDEAKARYDAALAAETAECATGDGLKCQAKRILRKLRREDFDAAELKLRTEKPEQVANADVKAAAALFARLPYVQADASSIEALLLLAQPFLLSLFCEVGAIVGFGIGLGHGKKDLPEAKPPRTEPEPKPITVRSASSPHQFADRTEPKRKIEAQQDLMLYIDLKGVVPSQDFLRERWGLRSKSTVSEWLAEWEERGLITRERDGKCKTVRRFGSRTVTH